MDNLGELRTHRIGEADVRDQALAEKRGDAAASPVEKLIRNYKLERRVFFLQRSNGAERQDSIDAQRFESENVGAKVLLGRRVPVAAPVPRQKRDFFPCELADHIWIGWGAPRRVDSYFFVRGKAGHRIEPAAADDSDGWFLHS